MTRIRILLVCLLVTVPLGAVAILTAPASAAVRTGPAPGRPGSTAPYLGSDKAGFGTADSVQSHVWFTLEPGGGTGEVYFPTIDTPAARSLGFVVTDGAGNATRVADVGTHHTRLIHRRSLTYRQTDMGPNRAWRLVTTYVTDPARSALRVDVHFSSLNSKAYRVFVLYEPTLSNTPADDTGRTHGAQLVASDKQAASALTSTPAFTATSNGFRGTSDGWTDLHNNGHLNWHYRSAKNGNVVQTGRTTLTGRSGHRNATLTIGYAKTAARASRVTHRSAGESFARTAHDYANGWRSYLTGKNPPPSLRTAKERNEYLVSEMVLAASEDKIHRGAYVASPTMPWAWGAQNPTGPYHLVWSRDLYEIATALLADGDRPGAGRALNFMFGKQQKADGSFPQNSTVTGKPFWTGLQLDEVADPILLAYQLHRFNAAAYKHVHAAADFLVGFTQDGKSAPWSPQERWENQDGYSPATIASEIAALVCAAKIARANDDPASAHRYLTKADAWRAHLKYWTLTTNGPYSAKPYFLRLTKDGNPDAGTTYSIGDSGPSNADQRTVVDPSFLELVRLGVFPASDKDIRNTIAVVDKQLSYHTARGTFWHRASFDGYGETNAGKPWILGSDPDSFVTHGRGWPILNGERGEYDIAAGKLPAARGQLATMVRTANSGGLLPEQVWDKHAPGGTPGFRPGTPTLSATPLAWTHAQYIRLANDIAAKAVSEQPQVVATRYGTN